MPSEPSAAATLGWVARGLFLARQTSRDNAESWLLANGAPPAAIRVLKSPIDAGGLSDLGLPVSSWAQSMRTRSVFFRLLDDNAFMRVPVGVRVGVTSIPQAHSVAEGVGKPISPITIANVTLAPQKAASLVVVSDELMRAVGASGQTALNRSLMDAVSGAVDAAFVATITAGGTTSTPSSGTSAVAAKSDLRNALLAIDSSAASKLYWVCGTDVAKRASTLDAGGVDAFQAMGAVAGEMANLPAIVSSGIPADSLLLVDAAAVAADGGPIKIEVSSQADIQLDSAPAPGAAAVMTSMFQSNSTALRAETFFGAALLRDNAVAMITSINWGGA